MISLSQISRLTKFGVYLLAAVVLLATVPCRADAPAPIPPVFQDLYTTLQNDINSFNTTLSSQWNGVKSPVMYSANLWDANANSGPNLPNSGSVAAIQVQLQELKAMGVQAVTIAVGFPMLYQPFFSSQSQYQQFVTFYQNVAASAHALGLKVIVDNETLRNGQVLSGWNTAAFYASLSWDQYQQARAQTAVTIAQTMHPDYMVVLEEPDTEAMMSGQSDANTVSGSSSMLSQILTAMQQANITGVKIGAGVGSWLSNYQQFIQAYVTYPLDFIDMHVIPVNVKFLPNALTIANIAAGAGKPVAMTQTWLRKVRDNELTTLTPDQLIARDPFSFWEPLDTAFLQTMQTLAYDTQMIFISPVESILFWAYLPYDDTTSALSPSAIMNQAETQSSQNMMAAIFTSAGASYYTEALSQPDTVPPTTPTNLTAASGKPTQSYLTWTASTDNIGVAGYNIFRNGALVGTTATTYYGDTGLTGATTYSYTVQAFDLGGNVSTPTQSVSVTTWNTTPPTPPQNPAAVATSCQKIIFSWSPATDVIGIAYYHIFRGTSASSMTLVATMLGTSTSYINYPVTAGTKYFFTVQAVDPDGNVSPMSAVASATPLALPAAPTKLAATANSTAAITLTWSAGPAGMGVGGYYIFRGTTSSNLVQIASQGSSTTYYNHSLTPGTTYYYAVKEVDAGGNVSPLSAVVSVTTLALPSPPANVIATALGKTAISLTWTPAPSGMPLSVYLISQGTSPASLSQIGAVTPTTLSLTIYNAKPGTTYYFGIKSVDTGGNISPISALATVTTPN